MDVTWSPGEKKYRYTYRLTRPSDGAFYIGSRSAATCPPEEDFGTHYFTSGVLKKEFRANPEQFTWVIHSEDYADDVAMLEDEQRLILESWDEPGRMNRSAYPVVFEMDEEWLENLARAQNTKWRENVAKGTKKRALSPEGRAQMEAARLKAQAPAARKKMSESRLRNLQDPAYRKRMAEIYNSPEYRKKMAEGGRKRSQDPVWLENVTKAAKKRGARQRAARLANEDALPFD